MICFYNVSTPRKIILEQKMAGWSDWLLSNDGGTFKFDFLEQHMTVKPFC